MSSSTGTSNKNKPVELQNKIRSLFIEYGVAGIVVVMDGEKSHYTHVGMGLGHTADILGLIKKDCLNKLNLNQEEDAKII